MSLLVFSDDWGRHPSSCQYLVGQLLDRTRVLWVNTIGMRRPKLEWYTVTRGFEKAKQWFGSKPNDVQLPANLEVVCPLIWPGFGWALERSINRRLIKRKLRPLIAALPKPVIAVTTMPTVADLLGELPVERWVYYCVDDFATWPGLDHKTLRRFEDKLIEKADRIVVVSEKLQERVDFMGVKSMLLTHGVDLQFWKPTSTTNPTWDYPRPWLLWWGLIDRRMDIEFIAGLNDANIGTIILVGPVDNPEPRLEQMKNVVVHPAVQADALPAFAAVADVLLLPYADLPVTRAIQPLKLKEYLATGKPVVARDLPAVREWQDCLDVASDADAFVGAVRRRLHEKITDQQLAARGRLAEESWTAKANQFYRYITEDLPGCDVDLPSCRDGIPS